MNNLTDIFGILREKLPDYEDRPQQAEMADEVLACLQHKKSLLVEAGTGVGKSFAYLIPAILSKNKTVISTATIALQDQVANKDLIFLQKTLPQDFSFAVLKGKNNYLCLKREDEFVELGKQYRTFRDWADDTETGDKDELPFIPEFWAKVCGDSDDCNGRESPCYNECFYYKHYRELYKNDILIVNHHILIYDILSDFKLLPFHNQLIVDEAHQLENVISHVLGSMLNHSRIIWLIYRLRGLKVAVDELFTPVNEFFKNSEGLFSQSGKPISNAVVERLEHLKEVLSLEKVLTRLKSYRKTVADEQLRDRIDTTITCVRSLVMDIDDFISRQDRDRVYYMTAHKGFMELRSNLVECAKPFSELCGGYGSLIMTSATLAVGGGYTFLKKRLGISDFRERVIGSPFDFKRQSLLYVDKDLPRPARDNNDTLQKEGLSVIEALIQASRGRALVLFTSYRHLNFVSRHIKLDYSCKSQGDMSPSRLIQWFKKTPNAVLLATATFWQGIDIKGEQLSLVIVVKMPFGTPGDPVYDEKCKRLGEKWFSDLALPSAILLLRQGIGRLIRGANDYGVVAILDTRLIKSSYGRTVLSSLPEMDVVHRVADVERFFRALEG